jgi:hypothetical protein
MCDEPTKIIPNASMERPPQRAPCTSTFQRRFPVAASYAVTAETKEFAHPPT